MYVRLYLSACTHAALMYVQCIMQRQAEADKVLQPICPRCAGTLCSLFSLSVSVSVCLVFPPSRRWRTATPPPPRQRRKGDVDRWGPLSLSHGSSPVQSSPAPAPAPASVRACRSFLGVAPPAASWPSPVQLAAGHLCNYLTASQLFLLRSRMPLSLSLSSARIPPRPLSPLTDAAFGLWSRSPLFLCSLLPSLPSPVLSCPVLSCRSSTASTSACPPPPPLPPCPALACSRRPAARVLSCRFQRVCVSAPRRSSPAERRQRPSPSRRCCCYLPLTPKHARVAPCLHCMPSHCSPQFSSCTYLLLPAGLPSHLAVREQLLRCLPPLFLPYLEAPPPPLPYLESRTQARGFATDFWPPGSP